MRSLALAVLVALAWSAAADAAERPLAPPLRHIADALVPLPPHPFHPQEGVIPTDRYVAFLDPSGTLRAWDSKRGRFAAAAPAPPGGPCTPRAGRHEEFVVYCPVEGGDRPPFLFSAVRGTVERIELPPPPGEDEWYVPAIGRRWLELRAGPEQWFLDRVTGELRRGGHLDGPRFLLINRDLDDPGLGRWLRAHEFVYRNGFAYWKRPAARLFRVGREGSRATPLLTYGRFATWLDARFAAAFDTRTRRRYRWPLRAVPAGLGLPHTDYVAIFVTGPSPRRTPDDEAAPMVRAQIRVARWHR
jgi:hypothetical protein